MGHIVAFDFINELLLLEREILGRISTLSCNNYYCPFGQITRVKYVRSYQIWRETIQSSRRRKVEDRTDSTQVGEKISLDQVLMVSQGDKVSVGSPLVNGAVVSATVLGHGRADKVKIFKMRRRKHYQKRQGHRQNFTEVMIDEIKG